MKTGNGLLHTDIINALYSDSNFDVRQVIVGALLDYP